MATIREIQLEVCAKHGISLKDMLSESRRQVFVRPRHEAMALARQQGNSLPKIGKAFGGKHHSSVRHAITKVTHG